MNLNPRQKSAVEAPLQPLLIVAGAGTGKTRTLTSRLIRLVEYGIPPEKILAITFTNKAAGEMRSRISISQSFPKDHWLFIGTFHSLGARILRKEGKLLGRSSNFVIFDDDDSFRLVKKIYKTLFGREKEEKETGPAFFAQKISKIKNGALPPGELEKSSTTKDKLALKFFRLYEEGLLKNNAFDFDDLIEKVVEIFRKYPAILKKYQSKFEHILVDEYQDLNNQQYELIKLLAGSSSKLTVVGDAEQMIYGWRYANIDIFLNFENDWPKTQVIFLEENYRSTKNIISAASGVIQNNEYRRQKTLWTKNEDGELIKVMEVGTEREEGEWIADEISNLQSSALHESNVAILYRTNAQSRALEQALLEREISYRIFGGVKFYERREIKDVVAALRLVFNPADQMSRERLEKNLRQTRFFEFQRSTALKKISTNPVELINIFLKATAYPEYLEKNFLNAQERLENIAELVRFASQFNDLGAFLEQISLVQQTDDFATVDKTTEKLPMVNLMTIHLAKGLEFDFVFVAGCTEGILPHGRSLGDQKELEEERRLFYVAMTRARTKLFLSFYNLPSRFLSEIPKGLMQFESLTPSDSISKDLDSEERYITLS